MPDTTSKQQGVQPKAAPPTPPTPQGRTLATGPRSPAPPFQKKLSGAPDALDDSSPATPGTPATAPGVDRNQTLCVLLPEDGRIGIETVINQHQQAFVVDRSKGNPVLLRIGSPALNALIVHELIKRGDRSNQHAIEAANDLLLAHAHKDGRHVETFVRVAPVEPVGVEIDLGDEQQTRVRITPGKVEPLTTGSTALFVRPKSARPIPLPAASGDYTKLKPYINLDWVDFTVLVGWISYTIAHPKGQGSKYVILVLQGGQGTGKSLTCSLLSEIIEPTKNRGRMLPSKAQDLAIAAQNNHLLVFDNVRSISPVMSDALCIASTGGVIAQRKLYSDDEEQVSELHAAVILNGIYSFIEQPDLAQRTLIVRLSPLAEESRRSEADLQRDLAHDLPGIVRGLYDLIAEVFKHLPDVAATAPTRMIEFSRWLAAIEKALGMPGGTLQEHYVENITAGQLDSLLDNELASVLLEFAHTLDDGQWAGTPAELLEHLTSNAVFTAIRPRNWPTTPISLSKRLLALQAALATQGIDVEFTRGKKRTITILKKEQEQ